MMASIFVFVCSSVPTVFAAERMCANNPTGSFFASAYAELKWACFSGASSARTFCRTSSCQSDVSVRASDGANGLSSPYFQLYSSAKAETVGGSVYIVAQTQVAPINSAVTPTDH